jgi:phage gp29-like protein
VWESRIAPVFGAPFAITAAPVGDPAQAQRAAQGCDEALRKVPDLPGVFSALLDARGVGFAACEMVWCRGTLLGQPAWVPGKILPIHSRRFRFSDHFELGLYDDGRAVGALRDAGWPVTEIGSRGAAIARLPAGKYLVHQPVGIHDYPTATGLVHAVARWWWVKQTVTKYWLAGAEIGANPRIIGSLAQTAGGATMDEFHAALEALAADGIMVLREGATVDIKEGTAKAGSEVWDTLFRRMDLAMSKLILGSTLNVEIDSGGGNRAASESQDHVTIRPRQRQDAAQMWCSIARDVFAYVLKFNPHIFAPNSPIPAGRSDIVAQPVPIDQLAVDSGAVRVDEMRARCGLPLVGGPDGQRFVAPITREPGSATTPTPDEAQVPQADPLA